MDRTTCPYCNTAMEARPDEFRACPSCGYSSAKVGKAPDAYLIIDSQLPDLMKRYHELQEKEDGKVVIIDRRVSHNQIAGADRRR